MKVTIKKFDVDMVLKNKGVEFEIKDNNDKHIGDLVVTKASLIWCKGKTTPQRGKKFSWNDFIEYANKLGKARRSSRRRTR